MSLLRFWSCLNFCPITSEPLAPSGLILLRSSNVSREDTKGSLVRVAFCWQIEVENYCKNSNGIKIRVVTHSGNKKWILVVVATETRRKKNCTILFAQVIALCYFRVLTINVVICQRSFSTVDKSLKTLATLKWKAQVMHNSIWHSPKNCDCRTSFLVSFYFPFVSLNPNQDKCFVWKFGNFWNPSCLGREINTGGPPIARNSN